MSPIEIAPCVAQIRMTGRPSNVATAAQARPDASSLWTMSRTGADPAGGSTHSTAKLDSLTLDQPRADNRDLI